MTHFQTAAAKTCWSRRFLALLALFATFPAKAHPGHGLGEQAAAHIITSPYHLATFAAVGAAWYFGARFVQPQIPRRILQSVGIVTVLTAVAMIGSRI